MTPLIAPSAYVDFTSPNSLDSVARDLSTRLFAGIPFVGLGEGLWDEVPAMKLARRFMGLEVELGGSPGPEHGYTLQVEAPDFPWERIERADQAAARADLTGYLQHLLSSIEGITISATPEQS